MTNSVCHGGRRGFVLWFTGLSGAGKSTLARLTADVLCRRGLPVEVLDGDEVRTNLCKGLGFSKEDRDTNIRRIGYVARLLCRHGVCVLTAAISPYRETRRQVREEIGHFYEVFVRCPLSVCIARDVKGLYKKALSGEIKHFTGVDDPYEEPLDPELVIDTHLETPEQSTQRVIQMLENAGAIPTLSQHPSGPDNAWDNSLPFTVKERL
ncbi:MAG TPA: adenylyl-sulfate kinase [Firmicutes bacterium]|nr:adenylyl-sulfate kinase [Bacillota bacterium]